MNSQGKTQYTRDRASIKQTNQVDGLTPEQVVNDLKAKRLPTFGTAQERKDRLKKHYGKFKFVPHLLKSIGITAE